MLSAGAGDPTLRIARRAFVRATRTPEGAATLHVEQRGESALRATAWGPGADWALARAADLLGLGDAPLRAREAPGPVRAFARRAQGLRLARTHRVTELLTLIVLQQKVQGREAQRAFRNLVHTFSQPAPGPFPGLYLPLAPARLRTLPPAACTPLGVTARQCATLRRIGWAAHRLEEAAAMSEDEALARLCAVPGVGPWSAASALLRGMGHADAVPVGDYNLPSLVSFNLTGEPRADDARMLALLEPYRGQRGRVIRWIAAAGRMPPRRGPRSSLRPAAGRRALARLYSSR